MTKHTFLSVVAISACTFLVAQNVGIGTNTPTNRLEVVSSAATSTNATIHATNTGSSGSGILGSSNSANTIGVRGTSTLGNGIQAFTGSGYALAGTSLSGTAIFAQSSSAYGLICNGKLKFSGGNTNPSNGAVLTSDADGNAIWKPSAVAFYANSAVATIGETPTKVEFSAEAYDTQNNFARYAGAVNAGSSVFTAPVSGIYHFSAAILFEKTGLAQNDSYMLNGTISFKHNGNTISYSSSSFINHANGSGSFSCYVYLHIDVDVHLDANDKFWVEAYNDLNSYYAATAVPLNSASYNGRFSGKLLFAD